MHTPGELAALYDDLSALHDQLVTREEALRADDFLPSDVVLAGRVSGTGTSAHLDIARGELEARVEECARLRDLLAHLLDSHQLAALRDHHQVMHSPGTAL